jgi:hypothetical protein
MRQSIISLAIAVLLSGCAAQPSSVEVTRLSGWGAYPAEPFIKVLQAPPGGLYVPIARLVVNAAAGLDRAQALTALEQKARDLGANALIVSDETRRAAPDLTFNPSGGTYTLEPPQPGSHLVGEAIHLSAADTEP